MSFVILIATLMRQTDKLISKQSYLLREEEEDYGF